MWRLGGYSIGNSDGYDIDLAGAISAIDFHGALQENRWNGHHLNLECADAMHYDMPDNQKKHYAAWYKYPANEDKIVGHSQHAYDRIQGSWHLQWSMRPLIFFSIVHRIQDIKTHAPQGT